MSMNEFVVTPIDSPLSSYSYELKPDAVTIVDSSQLYKRRVLQRLVTALPWPHFSLDDSQGHVQVCLEEYYYFSTDNNNVNIDAVDTVESSQLPIFRRVAVRSYDGRLEDSSETTQAMHASFILPITPLPPADYSEPDRTSSLMCWAYFAAYADYRLCVLASPTNLRILDVYPHIRASMMKHSRAANSTVATEQGDADISITLPFPMDSIFHIPLPSGGLLIQRSMAPPEEQKRSHTQLMTAIDLDHSYSSPSISPKQHDDQTPHTHIHSDHRYSTATTTTTTTTTSISNSTPLPSLFTLQHPLHEVKPCAIQESMIPSGSCEEHKLLFFAQVHHRVVFVGQPRDFQPQVTLSTLKPKKTSVLVVTYHYQLQQHALWMLQTTADPPKSLPLWKQHGSNKKIYKDLEGQLRHDELHWMDEEKQTNQDTVTLPPTSPFADIHADISLVAIHNHLEALIVDNDAVGKASRVFLATNLEETGDFLLCLVRPRNKGAKTMLDNTHQLDGFSVLSTAQNSWVVSHQFQLLCRSAVPIQATPISPPQYNIQQLESNMTNSLQRKHVFHSLPWWITNALNPPSAIDILICRMNDADEYGHTNQGHDKSSRTSLSLFRGNFHLVDCILPPPFHKEILSMQYPVLDQVDFVYHQEDNRTMSIRACINLRMVSSPVTEAALLAIGSALNGNIVPCSLGMSVFHCANEKGTPLVPQPLALCLRSDTARIAQVLARDSSSLLSSSYSFTDLEWFAFSQVCFSLFGISTLSTYECQDDSDDEAWNDLIQSDYHHCYSDKERLLGLENHINSFQSKSRKSFADLFHSLSLSTKDLGRHEALKGLESTMFCKVIVDALHMLYEDCKITRGLRDGLSWIKSLGSLLFNIFHHVRSNSKNEHSRDFDQLLLEYSSHYDSDIGDHLQRMSLDQSVHVFRSASDLSEFMNPPCFYSWLENIMKHEVYNGGIRFLNGTCVTMRKLLCLYLVLFPSDRNVTVIDDSDSFVAQALSTEGIQTIESLLDIFNPGLNLPILEALRRCRENPPNPSAIAPWPSAAYELIGRPDLGEIQRSCGRYSQVFIFSSVVDHVEDPENDGLKCAELYSSMIFPNDMRVTEAARLLKSSHPSYLHIERSPEVTDHAFERLKQDKLLLLCRRKMALSLGRGMLTFGTLRPNCEKPMPIPKISLVGRVPPTNATLNLDASSCPQDMSVWPDFHNGVAAGLRHFSFGMESASSVQINRAWILSNKPTQTVPPTPESNGERANMNNNPTQSIHSHGGLLMALGFGGHLAALNITDIYEYLTQGAVTITVGVLLGMAANKKGTCDASVTKILCLHLPSLLPPSFATIDVASTVQTAAITGIGLLYLESRNRLMTEFLLKELGKRPTNIPADREGYSLSCGLALGMINLCLRDESGLADLRIEERLHRYIVGGRDEYESHHDSDTAIGSNHMGLGNESERSSLIYEGDAVNIDVTAPAAILALGLIYMRSGSKAMASLLCLPDTLYRLDYIRPDLLFLRIVSRSLILWDDIEPSDAWIEKQIPKIIQKLYNQFGSLVERRSGMGRLAKCSVLDDDSNKNPLSLEDYHFLDAQLIRQSYAFIIAGSCFSLGLRYAGSGNIEAAGVVRKRIIQFLKLRDDNDPATIAQRPEKQIVDMCLSNLAIALALIKVGTGDLDTFRLFRSLRWKCDDTVKYGTHMAFGAAIGLLFLGSGSCTLGNQPADIAVLIASFFPRFPIISGDNQHHLQALRHLYALAVKRRLVDAVDVDTRESIFLPFEVGYKDETVVNMTAPCLLQNASHIGFLRVTSERYHTVHIHPCEFPGFDGTVTLFVKKKCGHLTFQEDPDGLRSTRVQTGISEQRSFIDLISSFTRGTALSAYSLYLFSGHRRQMQITNKFNPLSHDFESFCANIIYDCLTLQTPEMIQFYFSIYSAGLTHSAAPRRRVYLRTLRLIRTYCNQIQIPSDSILSLNAVAMMSEL